MIENIPYPRLLNASGGLERIIRPTKVSINLDITPLSDASITLPIGENLPTRGYVELFTCMGSAGVFRVRSPQDAYGEANTTAELEHAIVEVGDYLVLNKYDEMMAAGTAMQTIFSHYRGTKWQLGSVTALGNTQIAVQANYDRVLDAMLALLDQKKDCMMSFDFSTSPWTVNIVAKGTTVTAEGRLSRNVNYARVTYDDTELCTRAYYEKPVANPSATEDLESEWVYIDADTKSTYGLIEREVQTGSNYTPDEADRIATAYINDHKNPKVSVEIGAEELSSITGESVDTFTIGKMFRLALADYGVTVEKNITGLSFNDVYGAPRDISVRLDQEADTLMIFIHNIDSKGGGGGGGGGSRKKQDDEDKKFYAEFVNTQNKVGMVVGTYDGEYKIQGGEITLAINEDGGTTALLQADTIDIDGLVEEFTTRQLTAIEFNSTGGIYAEADIECDGDISCAGVVGCGGIEVPNGDLEVGGHGASWQTYEARYCTLGSSYTFQTTGGSNVTGRLVTGASNTTIHYLGY